MLCVRTEINAHGRLVRAYRMGAIERVKRIGLKKSILFYLQAGPKNLLQDLKIDLIQGTQGTKRERRTLRKC